MAAFERWIEPRSFVRRRANRWTRKIKFRAGFRDKRRPQPARRKRWRAAGQRQPIGPGNVQFEVTGMIRQSQPVGSARVPDPTRRANPSRTTCQRRIRQWRRPGVPPRLVCSEGEQKLLPWSGSKCAAGPYASASRGNGAGDAGNLAVAEDRLLWAQAYPHHLRRLVRRLGIAVLGFRSFFHSAFVPI